jgi:membrane-associated phospholipid phosphatase
MNTFYKIISLIFQPLLMPTYGMLMLVNVPPFTTMDAGWRIIAVAGTFLFTGLLPLIPIVLMLKRGTVSDLSISNKSERTMPYLFSLLAYVFWAMFLWRTLQLPALGATFVVGIAIGVVAVNFIILFINLKWKISAHMASVGALAGGVFGVCFRFSINPVYFYVLVFAVSILVGLSRIELKAHTPSQALAGFLLGFMCIAGPAIFIVS